MQVEHKIVLLHTGKSIIKGFNISHSMLRVGGRAYAVLIQTFYAFRRNKTSSSPCGYNLTPVTPAFAAFSIVSGVTDG
jgi:hypothetical protein